MVLLLRLDFWLGAPEVWGRPGIVLSVLAIVLAGLSAGEMVQLWPKTNHRPRTALVTAATIVMVGLSCVPAFVGLTEFAETALASPFVWTLLGIVTAFAMTFCYEMNRYGAEEKSGGDSFSELEPAIVADRLGRATLIYLYLSLLFGFLIPHRFLEGSNAIGLISMIALISTVKMSDTFAYFAGKSFGTIKLAPKLSPKKTLQGSLAAPAGGCIAVAIVVYVVSPLVFGITISKPWWWFVAYGVLVTGAGMVGDLAESLLKRDADRKDSSSWLPGLGGLLDVLDSLIFAAPVSWLLWVIG